MDNVIQITDKAELCDGCGGILPLGKAQEFQI